MSNRQLSCEERVGAELESTIKDLRALWDLYLDDPEASDDELGNMYEYGLCFDYVAPETFTGQAEGYFRYQLSTGGPGDEFRIYADQMGAWSWSVYRIEYWFLDWFDGASRRLYGADHDLLADIFESFFVDSGTADHVYEQAID